MDKSHSILLFTNKEGITQGILDFTLTVCRIYRSDLAVLINDISPSSQGYSGTKSVIHSALKSKGLTNVMSVKLMQSSEMNWTSGIADAVLGFDLIISNIEIPLDDLKETPVLNIPKGFDHNHQGTFYYLLTYKIEDIVAINVLLRLQAAFKMNIVLIDIQMPGTNLAYKRMLRKNIVQGCSPNSPNERLKTRSINLNEEATDLSEFEENSIFVSLDSTSNDQYLALYNYLPISVSESAATFLLNPA